MLVLHVHHVYKRYKQFFVALAASTTTQSEINIFPSVCFAFTLFNVFFSSAFFVLLAFSCRCSCCFRSYTSNIDSRTQRNNNSNKNNNIMHVIETCSGNKKWQQRENCLRAKMVNIKMFRSTFLCLVCLCARSPRAIRATNDILLRLVDRSLYKVFFALPPLHHAHTYNCNTILFLLFVVLKA